MAANQILSLLILWVITSHGISQTPIFLNFVSHNETSDSLDYDDSPADYHSVKTIIMEVCDTIIAKQAKYNMQVDANFIFGCLNFDAAAQSPNDLLEWANNSPYIDVDGHNHFKATVGPGYNPYNYADLAYLLDSCGVELERKILGGATYITNSQFMEQWTKYAEPINGFTFTDFVWQADVLWGGGTPGHVADYNAFGLWKPAGATLNTFRIHDPEQTLTFIGGGCKDLIGYNIVPQTGLLRHTTDEVIQNLKDLADFVNTLPPSENDFYTLNMLLNFRDFPVIPNIADSLAKIIDGIQPYVDQGKIIWATIAEKYNLWYDLHPDRDDYFQYDCEDIVLSADEPGFIGDNIKIFPNPVSEELKVELDNNEDAEICIYDLSGQKIYRKIHQARTIGIPVQKLQKGIYLLRIQTNRSLAVEKFLKI